MSTVLLTLLLAAGPVVTDSRGFQFTVPEGFEPFPGFQPTATKLYAFGKNLGTPQALTLTVDLLEEPVTAGAPSRGCGALMNSIDRTVGAPLTETWKGLELSGLRMVMTHIFGEVVVFCVDVPLSRGGLSVMGSGKPANEAVLHDAFRALLGSVAAPEPGLGRSSGLGALVLLALLLGVWLARRRRFSRAPRRV